MKFTLSWLYDYLDTAAPLDDILYALTDLGLEVEAVDDPARTLGAFRICRVIEAVAHPNADRLRLCRVATYPAGLGSPMVEVQVVCGAPNARTGLVGVFAPVGTHVPGTGVNLKPGVIRGVESNGMLCSERELMLSDDHDGIIDLPADAPLGMRFIDYRGSNDPMIHVKVTPNRPDALGLRGIARDLAARGLGRLKPLNIQPVAGQTRSRINVTIHPDLKPGACPHFTGRTISGVKNGPAPDWMQSRLKAIGLRPISVLVDITNYLTFALNRPLHVFDAAKLSGNLVVRAANANEDFAALDGKSYNLLQGQMVICDDDGPQSLAGIIGGARSGCTDETTEVFLESAFWDPITIAATGRALKLNSDARYRFERGVDPAFTLPGLELATQMILDLCGGTASDVVFDGAAVDTARAYRLDPARAVSLVGMDIPEATQRTTLESLGFSLDGAMASPPTWRPDILGEADLIEEIARIASLAKLQGKPLNRSQPGVPKPVLTPQQSREKSARRTLAALGYNDCVTYSFIDATAATLFGGGSDAVKIDNPISSGMSHLRPDLLPGLLRAAARNQARGFMDLALCEVGPVFHGGEPGEQHLQATGVLIGNADPRGPHQARRTVDSFDAKADAEAILAALAAPARVQIGRKTSAWWHPGRSGTIGLGPTLMATFGEIHPRVLAAMDVKGPAVAFTVLLAKVPLPKLKTPTRPALALTDLQSVDRDFAFIVDRDVEAITAVNAAARADKALIESVHVFDEFTGAKAEAQMGQGKKSIALTIRLQPQHKTLTEAEIDAVCARIIENVRKATGGALRALAS